jgi:hypothetical protein
VERVREKTNVGFDLSITARTEYENQKSLLVNSGDAPYIIPKTYDESAFVASGQIVPVSDWVQYMPNYMKALQEWGMEEDLKAKLKEDGKYYVLPGMWEVAGGGYSYIIRKDVFEAAGVDVIMQEANWTYEEFYEAMKKVKEHTGAKYVLSDHQDASLHRLVLVLRRRPNAQPVGHERRDVHQRRGRQLRAQFGHLLQRHERRRIEAIERGLRLCGGMFAYGGTAKLKTSKLTEGEKDYFNRILSTREERKLAPPIMATAEESEQMNLIMTPLIDYVKTMTLKFITGQESFDNWEQYKAQAEANGSARYTQMANEVFQKTKSKLGY